MANTYSQLYIHVVFAVSGRAGLIPAQHKVELYKYITGIINAKGQKLLAINGMPDHIHVLLNTQPDVAVSDVVRDMKANSSRFINERRWTMGKFSWQAGFGAFSYSASQLNDVIRYIQRQEEHHAKHSFRQEYEALLTAFGIEYNSAYIFQDVL